jgi:spermidine synthase
MTLDNSWFTEPCEECGSAFSLSIKKKLHEEQSEFQKIEIYETEKFGNLMVIDGFVMLTDRDNFLYHEMIAHPALYQHANPKKVVVIGGGDCGTMKEVLKHPEVEEAWQVEIDERVTRLSEQYFPSLCESNNDPRANFYFGDGIQWVKDAEPESIDIIIIDSTDPIGPAEGLFTEPFYRDCIKAMRDGGILVQQSESPLFHMKHIIAPLHKAMRNAGFQTTKTLHFPQCVYPSGWWTVTMAQKNGNLDTMREEDIRNKPFDTEYYNLDIHRAASAQPEFVRRALEEL